MSYNLFLNRKSLNIGTVSLDYNTKYISIDLLVDSGKLTLEIVKLNFGDNIFLLIFLKGKKQKSQENFKN